MNAVLEVLEVSYDLVNGSVTLTLGDLRGFGDSAGFWIADAAALPVRFANLDGYGAGSLVWNTNWHPDIKTWARQNVGYWTDENGFANSDDPDSFIPSSWI